jgi:hypothetical protein
MNAMTAPVAIRVARQGRQSAAVETLRDCRDELTAHRAEALELVDAMWPMLTRLELVAREVGPTALQTVYRLEAFLARYERHHLPDEPDPAAASAW